MMDKDSSTNRLCLKCSNEVTGSNDYCPKCADDTYKTASESAPSTLRESIDEVSSKFNIPRKKHDKDGVLAGLL